VTPISQIQAGLILGRVLANSGRDEEAIQLLEPVLDAADTAIAAEANEIIGYSHWRARREDKAVTHFAKAASLGAKTVRMYRGYAYLLTRASKHDEAVPGYDAHQHVDDARAVRRSP
jgi:tetratricopeptide (TPR) repeat protein